MDIRITPGKVRGEFRALPSKSEAHRALILAALSDKTTKITGIGATLSDDILRTVDAICALGAAVDIDGDSIAVTPPSRYAESAVIDCGESGSTLRFMIPVCAALGGEFRFIRRGRLPKRPITALTNALAGHGVSFAEDGDELIVRGTMTGGEFTIPGNESSQYITGILLALPTVGGKLRVVGELESAPYVQITLDIMDRFGATVDRSAENGEAVFSAKRREPCSRGGASDSAHSASESADDELTSTVRIGGDWSGAANLIAAGAVAVGLDANSAQGDRAILDILAEMGAKVSAHGGVSATFSAIPRAIDVDMRDTPDLVPTVAVMCAVADGTGTIRGTRRLRLKESDRVASTLALLRSLGVSADATEDEMTIRGFALHGGEVDSFGDHRIAMAAAVASCFADGDIVVRGAECVAKSYPGFWDVFRSLGGAATQI